MSQVANSQEKNPALTQAQAILQAFEAFQGQFKAITRRAKGRFEAKDWAGIHQDMTERLELQETCVGEILVWFSHQPTAETKQKTFWMELKSHYSSLIAARPDRELAETFFNSVARRIFTTVGVDATVEYVASKPEPVRVSSAIYKRYYRRGAIAALLKEIMADYPFEVGYLNLEENIRLAAAEVESHLRTIYGHLPTIDVVETLTPIFYRNKGAYIVGRLRIGSEMIPLALALLHFEQGVTIDAVLLTQDELSIIFSFTRSYFLVETEEPRAIVAFLKSLLPLKRIAELYISIGYHKHGKTELYRDLEWHLATSTDRFEIAEGERGMVMTVFTLPSYDIVFKIIKDRFDPPKKTTRQKVMERYELVFKRDRAGRLVDTQEYEYLTFAKSRFAPELLAELLKVAASTVLVEEDRVIIKHVYTERRLTPLNLYLQKAGRAAAQEVIRDCGKCIKELAATNIFPGDFLLKNFGVTRHDRVVFYDYDELGLVTDYNFREIPPARNFDDEMGDQPWYFTDEYDIFPEEFKTFMGLPAALFSSFAAVHGDLFGVDFWRSMQAKHRTGEAIDIFPYRQRKRLRISDLERVA
jgi:isocitrate dehydrogenase kinase/phosphatase